LRSKKKAICQCSHGNKQKKSVCSKHSSLHPLQKREDDLASCREGGFARCLFCTLLYNNARLYMSLLYALNKRGRFVHTFPIRTGRPRNTEAHCDLPPARTRPHTAGHSVFRGLTSVHNASGAELAAWRSTPHAARSVFASGSDRPPHAVVTALAVRECNA
jgi:hypothetical protein